MLGAVMNNGVHLGEHGSFEPEDGPVETPCIDICKINHATGYCIGCCRSSDEIARWASMSDAERRAIMDELDRRRVRLPEEN